MRRWTREAPCPICSGHSGAPKGRGERCWGYVSADGAYAYCTRDERAGGLDLQGESDAYAHRLEGACRCGIEHGVPLELPPPQAERDPEQRRECALRVWMAARSARGSLAETYLRSRRISIELPERIRYAPELRHTPSERSWPAMVALVTEADDRPLGVHRTYLARDGQGKAPVEPAKMSLGPIRGGAVRLAPAAERIIVAEGIETALAAAELSGLPAWAALSTSGLRALELPACVRAVQIAADRDENGAGVAAARAAAQRWIREGRAVEIVQPNAPHKDFANVLAALSGSSTTARTKRTA